MDYTPNAKSRLMCRRRNSIDSGNASGPAEKNLTSTPKQSQLYNFRNDSSPLYFQSTQEVIDDLDVVWDWNSPQSGKNKARKQKRTFPSDSVKVPLKRHVSHNQIQTFDELKSKLEALRNQLNCETECNPDETIHDVRSTSEPLRDVDVKQRNQNNDLDLVALFEDSSVEEELFLCSQRVEEQVSKTITSYCNKKTDSIIANNAQETCSRSGEVNCSKKINFEANGDRLRCVRDSIKKAVQRLPDFGNNSFDLALETFENEDVDLLTQANVHLQTEEKNNARRHCDNNIMSDSDVEPARIKCDLDEIKRKRQQALAKLEAKKKLEALKYHRSPDKSDDVQRDAVSNETSPFKCSPEEIEQKRLHALAKLQAKKKQDVIERNRQEALKRLEMNKKKRALNSQQRSLISRTYSR